MHWDSTCKIKMKCGFAVALLSLASCAASAPARRSTTIHASAPAWQTGDDGYVLDEADAEPIHQTIALLFGGRWLDSDTFQDVDTQPTFGISVDSYKRGEPFGYEVYLMRSSDTHSTDTSEVQATLTELSFGFRGYFETPTPVVAYVGGGLAGIFAKSETLSSGAFASDDAFSPGFYAHAGVFYPFENQNLRVGLDYRQMMLTDIQFEDGGDSVSGDADYGQLTAFIGWSF